MSGVHVTHFLPPPVLNSLCNSLQAAELSLEELLALYGYTVSDPEKDTCHMAAGLPNMKLDKVRYENGEHGKMHAPVKVCRTVYL